MAVHVAGAAQDTNANPNYGSLSLNAGFDGDPQVVALKAGGDLNASSSISSSCSGYITNAPDVRLNYSAGSLPLIISVASASDTTLVVNAPDGQWYCDDDSGSGTNPSVRFNSAQSGRYEVWVGTYSSGSNQDAQLHVSELSSQ